MTQYPWIPRYVITPAIARGLMEIEAARAVVTEMPLPFAAEAELRRRARLRSTHHPTRIEGDGYVSRLIQHASSSTTKTGYTERNTYYVVLRWSLGRCRTVCS